MLRSFSCSWCSALMHTVADQHVANMCAELDQLRAHFDEQQRSVSELRYNNSMLTALNAALGIECQQLRSVTAAAAYAQGANAMHLRILLPCAPCSSAILAHPQS